MIVSFVGVVPRSAFTSSDRTSRLTKLRATAPASEVPPRDSLVCSPLLAVPVVIELRIPTARAPPKFVIRVESVAERLMPVLNKLRRSPALSPTSDVVSPTTRLMPILPAAATPKLLAALLHWPRALAFFCDFERAEASFPLSLSSSVIAPAIDRVSMSPPLRAVWLREPESTLIPLVRP